MWVDQEPAPSHRTPGLKRLEVPLMDSSIIRKEGTPTMTTTDTLRLSFLPESRLRSQRQWTHKNWLCRFRCMKRCQRSIRDRKKRSIRKSILKRSVGRPNNILRKRMLHLMVREPLDLCKKIQKSSRRAISELKRMTFSHPLIKEEQLLTLILILVQVQALRAANPKRIILADLKFRSPSRPLK